MTVMVADSSKRFHGSGSNGPFTWSWRFFKNSEILVYLIPDPDEENLADETLELLTEGTDYTLTGAGSYTGGSLTLVGDLLEGQDLYIKRMTVPLQETSIRNQGNNFRPEVHEETFDRMAMMIQDQARETTTNTELVEAMTSQGRTIKVPVGESGGVIDSTEYASRSGKVLGWNTFGALAVKVMNYVTSSGLFDNPWVDVRAYESLNEAVADLAGTDIQLRVFGTVPLTEALTVPKNIQVKFMIGGIVDNNGFDTIYEQPIEAGRYPIFTGAGQEYVKNDEVYPEWWGSNVFPGVTDMSAPTQKACIGGKYQTVKLGPTTYIINDVEVSTATNIEGSGTKTCVYLTNPSGRSFHPFQERGGEESTEAFDGLTSGNHGVGAYECKHIRGISFRTTAAIEAKIHTDPFETDFEATAIALGGGIFGVTHNAHAIKYAVKECNFYGFKRGVALGNGLQGFGGIDQCSFNMMFAAIESLSYEEAGEVICTRSQFLTCYHYYKVINTSVPYPPEVLGTHPVTDRFARMLFPSCYFAGWWDNTHFPFVKSTWNNGVGTYPDMVGFIGLNDGCPDFLIDADSGIGVNNVSVYFNNETVIEPSTLFQKKAIHFNLKESASAELSLDHCTIGIGYDHTGALGDNRPEVLIDARAGFIYITKCRLAQFGDPDAQFDTVVRLKHRSQLGQSDGYDRYNYGSWEVELLKSPSSVLLAEIPLLQVEALRNTDTFLDMPDETQSCHYVAPWNTTQPKRLDKEQVYFISGDQLDYQLDFRHLFSTVINNPTVANTGLADFILPAANFNKANTAWVRFYNAGTVPAIFSSIVGGDEQGHEGDMVVGPGEYKLFQRVQVAGDGTVKWTEHNEASNAPVLIDYGTPWVPNCDFGEYQRMVLTGDLSVSAPTNAENGTILTMQLFASAAPRTVTLNAVFKAGAVFNNVLTGDTTSILTFKKIDDTPTWMLQSCVQGL